MTKYVSGIVQRASPNVGAGRIRPAGRSLGTPALKWEETWLHSALEKASKAHNRAYTPIVRSKRSSGERRLQQNDSLKWESQAPLGGIDAFPCSRLPSMSA